MKVPGQFRRACVACGARAPAMNKEHFWPQWLIRRTGTHKTGVRFDEAKFINPRKMTIPLCIKCNTDFGRELEDPTRRIFDDLEVGAGLSDAEAELLIRWLWKFEGLAWCIANPQGEYTEKYTLRDRVLLPIDEIRGQLTLAVSLASAINPEYGDAPMGLDSFNRENAIFVSGVFSRVALMVLLRKFETQVPENFSIYRLAPRTALGRDAKLFFPQTGFETCADAVRVTRTSSLYLSYLHDTQGFENVV
jgi:hypothetical protein